MQGRVVPEYSQEYKLREALVTAGVSHDAGVVANLNNVQMKADGIVYFCNSKLAVASELAAGDGGLLPNRVTLVGEWEFPTPGFYDIRNARIHVNGTISISTEEDTEFVPAQTPATFWSGR
jgi:hypothetical protein